MKMRFLRTVEKIGTVIQHKKHKTEAVIIGSVVDAFVVETAISGKGGFSLKLPFDNINQWEVMEDE